MGARPCGTALMRHWFILLAASIIMLVGLISSLVMFGDQARLKALLIGHVETQVGRQLSIDGAVSLRFFPRFRIEAEQIRLSGPREFQGPELVSADSLTVEVRLLPLIFGRVETGEMRFEGVRLNLAMDDAGLHTLGGLMRRPGRQGAPGITAGGPLRLEDVEIEIAGLLFEGARQIQVDRIELDGLVFDRALNVEFQGAIGRPVRLVDVQVDGVLFVPAGSGQFHMADMRLTARHAPDGRPFALFGALNFVGIPPRSMALNEGLLSINRQQIRLQGTYEKRQRPYFSLSAEADKLDLLAASSILSPGTIAHWPVLLTNWVAENDFELRLSVAHLNLGPFLVPTVQMTVVASAGAASVRMAQTNLPGGLLELEGHVETDPSGALITGRIQLDVDDLATLLESGVGYAFADGAGQIRIQPVTSGTADILAEAELQFFDGSIAALSGLREVAGMEVSDRFDSLRGQVQILADALVFSLLIRDESAEVRVQAVWLRPSGLLHGTVIVEAEDGTQRFELSGSAASPQFVPADSAPATQ